MKKPQKFIDALQEDSEWMYADLKKFWVKKFSQKWEISDVTMRKYMPKKDFIPVVSEFICKTLLSFNFKSRLSELK